MASWFTRALDRVTPWDRGGEAQRRKEREEEERRRQQNKDRAATSSSIPTGVAQPSQTINVQGQKKEPEPKKPTNIFEDLNKGLVFNKPNNILDINKSKDTKPTKKPKPGSVIKPKLKVGNYNDKRDLILPDGRRSSQIKVDPKEQARRTLEKELDRGKSWEDIARDNKFDLEAVKKYSQATRPNYGIKIERPDQGISDRLRDIFDANTEADKYRRQQGNIEKGENKNIVLENPGNIAGRTPIIGTATKILNTLATQGASIPAVTEGMLLTRLQSELTEEMIAAQRRGDKEAYESLKRQLDLLAPELERNARRQEAGSSMFEKNSGGLLNTGTLYDEEASRRGDLKTAATDIVAPTAVAGLDLASLGFGGTIGKEIGKRGLKQAVAKNPRLVAALTGSNYASGDIDARGQGASNEDAVKSGLLTALLGAGPDIALPAVARTLKGRILPKISRGRGVNAKDAVEELDDAAISASAEAAMQATQPRPIRIAQNIPVVDEGVPQPIRVRNMTEPKPLIREFPGDAPVATPDPLVRRAAEEAREEAGIAANNATRPTQRQIDRFEGVTPRQPEAPFKLDPEVVASTQNKLIDDYAAVLRDMGEGNGVVITPDGRRVSNNVRFGDTKGKKMTKAAWREEAERQLRAGEADPAIQKVFDEANDPEVQAMLAKGERPDAPNGKPVKVEESKSVPIRDETVVPKDLPETPGEVRATAQDSPMQNKSEAAATKPVTRSIAQLPSETEEILANPKKFNKRQVAAARNQRKMARQYAKIQEETAEALERVNATSSGRQTDDGFAPTGKFAKGKNKNIYEKASKEAESARAQSAIANQSADDLIAEMGTKSEFTQFDVSRINEMRERLMQEPGFQRRDDFRILDEFYKKAGTQRGQGLALYNRILRRNATGDRLTNQWYTKLSKVADDTANITDADIDAVAKANDNFTQLRDQEVLLEEQYLRTGSEKDFNAWQDAYNKAAQADIDAKTTELKVAKNALKGSKNDNVAKVLADMEREADLNMMDHVTASQLSGPATGFRNFVGTELAGVENRLFANTRARITNKLFGENVGGYNRKAARAGRKEGVGKFGDDIRRRAVYSGKNPIKHAQNWATSVNSMGDSSLYSQARSRLGRYYENQLKKQGYSGKDLDMRVKHAIAKDPDDMGGVFLDASMKSSGLSGLYQKTQKIEKSLADSLEGQLGKALPPRAAKAVSKGIVRLGLGYPTATGNFVIQSGKRAALGVPSFMEAGFKGLRGNKQAAALAFERGLKEAGSGAAGLGTGIALSNADLITGFYPEDPDARDRWKDEGKSELSVKIGDGWYPIPTQFGMLGLPLVVGAALNEGGADGVVDMFTDRKKVSKLLPTDQAYGVLQVLGGEATTNQDKSFAASTIRSFIPGGSLLNQTAKGLDETANDTTTKDFWSNVFDQVISGVPGVNNMADIPDKLSSTGEPIKNPNLLETYTGARSVEQEAGVQNSQEVDKRINEDIARIGEYGLLDDPNMEGVLEDSAAEALNKYKAGQQLDESDIKALKKGYVKGVELSGTDTAYLEREQYDTNLAVLKLKRDLAQEDPTTKPSSLEKLDTAIKRGEIYKELELPYQDISDYQDIGVEEWRKMGDPDEDEYDPDMYQKLWDIDQIMTEAGVSYKRGDLKKNKYYLKDSKGRGRGGSGSRKLGGDFGKLDPGSFSPQVREYETIDQQSGVVPVIRKVRPNIVHKISASR